MAKLSTTQLQRLSNTARYFSLYMSSKAGSGHPTSSLSAADIMTAFFATQFRYDFDNPKNPNNDRLIFSKGHASPLYYALFTLTGAIKKEDLDNYRTFDSVLEGHPTPRFPYTEASTGSLGQGLSIGVGFALNGKYIDKLGYKTVVLLGDGEMAEGSVWEAMEIASHYKLNNLTGIIDVNRLGQSEETMLGHDVEIYKRRAESFGWETVIIDGHNFEEILGAFEKMGKTGDKPYLIIAKTLKGKGISVLENKDNWHGKPVPLDQLENVLSELGPVDLETRITVQKPPREMPNDKLQMSNENKTNKPITNNQSQKIIYKIGDEVPTRKSFGEGLARIGELYPNVVSLDAEVKNSSYAEIFKAKFPERFFEMYIAEQNMVGAAVGFAKREKIPFVSTFGAFLTRAYDQIRMAALSQAEIKFVGSHAGISIGEDGPSQMALEDISMFRTIHASTVLYPSDAVSTDALVEIMTNNPGMMYLRTTRGATPVIYGEGEEFGIGGSKVHYSKNQISKSKDTNQNAKNNAVIIAAGITLHESLKAQQKLSEEGIETIVVDLYSIKPIDEKTLKELAKETDTFITVEDHWFDGGIGDAVLNVFANHPKVTVRKLAVREMPRSGKPAELLVWAGIDSNAIIKEVKR